MSIKTLNPYLVFDGQAEEALALYTRALGAKTEGLMRFSEVPGDAGKMCNAQVAPNRIMHAIARIGDAQIMMSDTPPGQPVSRETNVSVALQFSEPSDLDARFDALAAGGTVTMPLHDAFWGGRFGMLTDRFGIHWMFNCDKNHRS